MVRGGGSGGNDNDDDISPEHVVCFSHCGFLMRNSNKSNQVELKITLQGFMRSGSAVTLGPLKTAPVKKSGLSMTERMAIVPP